MRFDRFLSNYLSNVKVAQFFQQLQWWISMLTFLTSSNVYVICVIWHSATLFLSLSFMLWILHWLLFECLKSEWQTRQTYVFFFKWLCCPVSCFQQMTLIETHFVEAFWYFLQLDIRFRHLLKWLLRFLRLHQKLAKIPITLMNKITQNRWFQNLNKT